MLHFLDCLSCRGKRHHKSGGQPCDPSLQHVKHHGPKLAWKLNASRGLMQGTTAVTSPRSGSVDTQIGADNYREKRRWKEEVSNCRAEDNSEPAPVMQEQTGDVYENCLEINVGRHRSCQPAHFKPRAHQR
ncbi:unnamed protein product [Pleuronectes platessa]|uniref:Uncharacterized protein n=1 Tax=Pleuronectes platessa TaxID=8262 RepID=A0A9N7TVV5_PLEPL|nr:unnamed protein product [Pleuronectes platessa]